MRRMSLKRRQLIADTEDARNAFRMQHPRCMICGEPMSDIHEMARGSLRSRAYKDRHTWLSLCRKCHDAVDDYAKWPLARQLNVKQHSDPEFYNLERFNEIRHRAPNAIDQSEVDRFSS